MVSEGHGADGGMDTPQLKEAILPMGRESIATYELKELEWSPTRGFPKKFEGRRSRTMQEWIHG
jgi:hypothetical protein